jgi:hypothetical protein
MMNVSSCGVTEKHSRFIATVYNPRSQEQTIYIRLPVTDGFFTAIDPDGSELVTQLVPLPISTEQQLGAERVDSISTHELLFQAANLPPLCRIRRNFQNYTIFKKIIKKKLNIKKGWQRSQNNCN